MSSSKPKTVSKRRQFYVLAKPGIIYANVITAIAGYLFAANLNINLVTLTALICGLALLIGGACAYNNYLDRGLDKKMTRTQSRGLVNGTIKNHEALIFATTLTLAGLAALAITQNLVTVTLAVIAFVDYVILYGIGKRKTVHGTLIGCISGSISLAAGYTAVVGRFDLAAALLFLIMVAWQMAHFYGIALYRIKDYKSAGLPVMPVQYGERSTQIQVFIYIILFIAFAVGLTVFTRLNSVAGGLLTALGAYWLYNSAVKYRRLSPPEWGKNVFLTSLLVMIGLSALLALNPLIDKIA